MSTVPQGVTPEVTPVSGATPNSPQNPDLAAENSRLKAELQKWQTLGATPESVEAHIKNLNTEAKDHRLDAKAAKEALEPLKQKVEQFEALGSVDEIKTFKARASRADELEQEKVVGSAAKLAGFDPEVLQDQMTLKGFTVAVEQFEENGQVKEVAYAIEGEEKRPLTEYAETKLTKALPSLRFEQKPAGTPHLRQTHGNTPTPAALTFEQMKERKLRQSEYPTF